MTCQKMYDQFIDQPKTKPSHTKIASALDSMVDYALKYDLFEGKILKNEKRW